MTTFAILGIRMTLSLKTSREDQIFYKYVCVRACARLIRKIWMYATTYSSGRINKGTGRIEGAK